MEHRSCEAAPLSASSNALQPASLAFDDGGAPSTVHIPRAVHTMQARHHAPNFPCTPPAHALPRRPFQILLLAPCTSAARGPVDLRRMGVPFAGLRVRGRAGARPRTGCLMRWAARGAEGVLWPSARGVGLRDRRSRARPLAPLAGWGRATGAHTRAASLPSRSPEA